MKEHVHTFEGNRCTGCGTGAITLERETEMLRRDNREVVAALQDSQLEVLALRRIINEAKQILEDDINHGGSRAAPSSGCLACDMMTVLERREGL